MRILVVMDGPERIHPETDTTIVIIDEARRRGHVVDTCQPAALELDGAEVGWRAGAVVTRLAEYAAVLMRKDPPVDNDYYFATLLLDRARGKTLLVNDPRALRDANEKLYIFNFPSLIAPTRVTRSIPELKRTLAEWGGQMIVKPLDACGGSSVFHVRAEDRNTNVILETMSADGTKLVMAQRYLPEARQGDKRILLLDGEPIGAVLRVPRADETRGNLHVGGTATRTTLTPRDLEICATLAPKLREDGLYLVGIDVIGGFLTEVNVTSPTGVQEINRLEGARLEARIVDWLERRAAAASAAPAPVRGERWLPLLFLALALVALAPIFRHPTYYASAYDWRYFQSWIEVGRRSVMWFHQVPLWNPYGCGGEVLLANPQSEVASPTFLWALLLGTALGVKLMLVSYYFCAFDGMYRLARDHELTVTASLLASVLFGAGGWLALHLSSGHSNFASAALFPYLVLCYRRGRERLEWAIPLGAIAAWIVAHGGTSTPAMAAVLLATVSTVDAAKCRSWKPYRVLAAGALCAGLLGAARLLPALEFALDHPRRQWETDSSTIWEIIRNAYYWAGLQQVPGKRYWFHEYGYRLAYATPPLVLWSLGLAFAALRNKWRRARAPEPGVEAAPDRALAWWWVVVVGAGIVAGRAIPYGPWWLLKHLPIYRDLRVPSRYAILLALALPLLCAGALDDLRARLAERRSARLALALAAALVVIAAGDGVAFQWARWHKIFDMPQREAGPEVAFHHVHGSWQSMMFVVMEGHGAIGCDEEAPLERAAELDEGAMPQARLQEPAAGRIEAIHWTPNRVELQLALDRPATVMINENWNEHWKTSAGRVVRVGPKVARDADGGRLGVEAPEGRYVLAVYYRPRSFVVGASITLAAFPSLLALWVWRRRRAGGR